jgi:general secretion pathway protein I
LKKSRSESGTSLLEVLVAVAVISIALVSFVTLVVGALDVEEHARKLTEATIVADEKLKEVERGPFPETGKTTGLVSDSEPDGFSYRMTITDTQLKDVRQVDVEVLWDREKRSVTLTGYVPKQ